MCLTRDDFGQLFDANSRYLVIYTLYRVSFSDDRHVGARHGVRPLESVGFRFGGVPTQTSVLMTAARLGLEVENDVRVAAERLGKLRGNPLEPNRPILPMISDEQVIASDDEEPYRPPRDDESINSMPLL